MHRQSSTVGRCAWLYPEYGFCHLNWLESIRLAFPEAHMKKLVILVLLSSLATLKEQFSLSNLFLLQVVVIKNCGRVPVIGAALEVCALAFHKIYLMLIRPLRSVQSAIRRAAFAKLRAMHECCDMFKIQAAVVCFWKRFRHDKDDIQIRNYLKVADILFDD